MLLLPERPQTPSDRHNKTQISVPRCRKCKSWERKGRGGPHPAGRAALRSAPKPGLLDPPFCCHWVLQLISRKSFTTSQPLSYLLDLITVMSLRGGSWNLQNPILSTCKVVPGFEMATLFSSSFVMESSLLPKQNKLINVCGLKYSGILSAAAFKLLGLTAKGNGF